MRAANKGALWLFLAALLGGSAAAALPLLIGQISWSTEQHLASLLGQQPADDVPCLDPQATAARQLLARVVARLHPLSEADRQFPLTVAILQSDSENAFATLGGHIYVYSGLLERAGSAEELAAVLAHEIEHVRLRHVLSTSAVALISAVALSLIGDPSLATGERATQIFLGLQYDRALEQQADAGAIQRLRDGQVDLRGWTQFFQRIDQDEHLADAVAFLSSHPPSRSRAVLAQASPQGEVRPLMTPEEWQIMQRHSSSAGCHP